MTVPEGVDNWRTSSYSGQGQDCVEVRLDAGVGAEVGIRDTKNRGGGELGVAPAVWRALTESLR